MRRGIFAKYDRVRVISLPDRKDRRRAMRRELRDIPFAFFDGYRVNVQGLFSSPGALGAVLSHVHALAEAAAAGESILVLEDDCKLTPEAWTIDTPDVDILWAGWESRTDNCIIGAQCVGYSSKAAKLVSTYVRNLLDPGFPPDPVAASEPGFNPRVRPPYDGALVWFLRTHPEVSAEFAPLTRQRSSRSDITPGRLDAVPIVRALVSLARTAKAALS